MNAQATAIAALGLGSLCAGLTPVRYNTRPEYAHTNSVFSSAIPAQRPEKRINGVAANDANSMRLLKPNHSTHQSSELLQTPPLPTTVKIESDINTEPLDLSCPLLPNYIPRYPDNTGLDTTANNGAPSDESAAGSMAHLVKLKSGLADLLIDKGLAGKISWRVKSADSTLGKLILRAIKPNSKKPLMVRDSQHACQLIADNHHRLTAFVEKLHATTGTPAALLDQLGLRVVLTKKASAQDCLDLAQSIKQHLKQPDSPESTTLGAFELNTNYSSEKDYITHPKPNGYQSYHLSLTPCAQTSQSSSDHQPIELQIRTASMHNAAVKGDANHDVYKENQRLLLDAFRAYYGALGVEDMVTADQTPPLS